MPGTRLLTFGLVWQGRVFTLGLGECYGLVWFGRMLNVDAWFGRMLSFALVWQNDNVWFGLVGWEAEEGRRRPNAWCKYKPRLPQVNKKKDHFTQSIGGKKLQK